VCEEHEFDGITEKNGEEYIWTLKKKYVTRGLRNFQNLKLLLCPLGAVSDASNTDLYCGN